ncbi:MAG: hypothetical protein R3E50_09745 [Halioglobus sp.]
MLVRVASILQLILLLCAPGMGMAQTQAGSESAGIEETLQDLDRNIAEAKLLDSRISMLSEKDREAMIYRRDQRDFGLLQEMGELAQRAAKLPEDDPQRTVLTRRLQADLGGVIDVIFQRNEELDQRISRLNRELESLTGAPRLEQEAYLFSLQTLQIKSFQAAVDVIEGRKALGLPVNHSLDRLKQQLYTRAEILMGRLEYSAAVESALSDRLKEDSKNAELTAALGSSAMARAEDLQQLSAISTELGRLDLDNSEYKALLLQQGSDLSVRDIEGALVTRLIRESWDSVRVDLIEQAPDLLFNLAIFVVVLLVFQTLSRLTRRAVISACTRSS